MTAAEPTNAEDVEDADDCGVLAEPATTEPERLYVPNFVVL